METQTIPSKPAPRLAYGIGMAVITCVLWGLESILVKISGLHVSPELLTISYFSLSTLAFGSMVVARKPRLPCGSLRSVSLVLVGGVSIALFYYLFVYGVRLSGPAQASVILQSEPFFVAILAMIFLKENLNSPQRVGLAIALLGFVLFGLDRWANNPLSTGVTGNLLVLCASLAWSVYALCQRALCREYTPLAASFSIFFVAAVLVLVAVKQPEPPTFTFESSLVLFLTSAMAFLAYAALSEAFGNARAAVVALIANLSPLITISAVFLLSAIGFPGISNEPISLWGYLGVGAILAGSIHVARSESRA